MAKRARGSISRPGQRPPTRRTTSRPAGPDATPAAPPTTSGGTLTDADIARAAALEAEIVAQQKAAAATPSSGRVRTAPAPRPAGSLAVAASEEYAYVARDVRRIVLIGGSLIALLFGGFALVSLTGLGTYH